MGCFEFDCLLLDVTGWFVTALLFCACCDRFLGLVFIVCFAGLGVWVVFGCVWVVFVSWQNGLGGLVLSCLVGLIVDELSLWFWFDTVWGGGLVSVLCDFLFWV